MASPRSLPSWIVALGAGAASVPVVGPWISGAVTHRYLGPTVVAVVALVVGGLGKLATDLLGHLRPRLVAWLELLLVRWFSRFGPWYRRVVLTDSRTMGREGFGGLVARGLDLDAVYVDVSLVSRAPRSASRHLVRDGRNEGDRRQDITGYLGDADQTVLVVLGGPGSGKSTLLRRIARQTYLDPKPHGRRIPIFLALREHVAAIVADPAIRLSTLVGRAKAPLLTGGTVPGLLAPEPRRTDALVAWFENLLVAGRCVVLLDGLDEVATEGERSAIVTWANTQILRYARHGNHYVLSSRPDGYRTGGLVDAAVLEVEPFTTAQVNAFVVDAYAAGSADGRPGVARRSSLRRFFRRPGSGEVVRRGASRAAAQRAADLSRQLGEASRLRPLTRNPLLLTMLFFVHRDRGSLPKSRLELYRQICRTVLEDRQKDKRITVPLPVEQAEFLLSGLALAMTREGRATTWTRAQVLDEIGPHMRALRITAEDFLDLAGLHGLFVESGIDRYAFTHRTFQEYLAAVALSAAPPETLPVDDPWWHETLLFYAMVTGPGAVVRECLRSETVTAWALAFDCADHATDTEPLDPDLALRLEKLLVVPVADSGLRRLVAGVLATRHLRDVVHTARDHAICARLVPAKLYQLFQDDTSENLPIDPAWVTYTPDTPDHPVLGVLGGFAAEFVVWINTVSGGGRQCRLPTEPEASNPAVRELFAGRGAGAPPSLWTSARSSAGGPALWIPPGQSHPWTVSAEEIRHRWGLDLEEPRFLLARLLLVRSLSDLRLVAQVDRDRPPAERGPGRLAVLGQVELVIGLLRGLLPAEEYGIPGAAYVRHRIDEPADGRVGGIARLARDLRAAHANVAAEQAPAAQAVTLDVAQLDGYLDVPVARSERQELVSGDMGRVIAEARRAILGHRNAEALDQMMAREFVSPAGALTQLAPTALAQDLRGIVEPLVPARTVSPEDLAGILRRVCLEHLALSESPSKSAWALAVSRQLEATSAPVFAWHTPVTPDLATRIRAAALCLAGEALAQAGIRRDLRTALDQVAGWFLDIAAGVTLLEQRASGPARPTEGILLAVD
ncbi:NACHT domain-containing protein [Longispora sp. NPDC051575]|uniref:NACHT domain-containing protein n=1 Tax=Longispora sp. NPDC051575 TaxID=3154943 RepID=UPI00341902BF